MHVLLATDGSPSSIAAAHRAGDLLRVADHVTLLNVVTKDPGDDTGGFASGLALPAEPAGEQPAEQDAVWNAQMAEAGAELERTAAALTSAQIDKRVEVGDVGGTVCRIAGELDVDVIVVGAHGHRGAIERILLGSVSEQIVRHAPCAVLVVRPEPEAKKKK
jgi:nucleotide-binding universal stress UspA family protein